MYPLREIAHNEVMVFIGIRTVSHVQIDTPFYDSSQDQNPINRLCIYLIAAMLIFVTTIFFNFTTSLSDHYIIISYHPVGIHLTCLRNLTHAITRFKDINWPKFWTVIQFLKQVKVHPKR